MDFYIFSRAEVLLDVRADALEAIHTEEEYRLDCEFPITDDYTMIEHGMLIGFYDIEDVFQAFEVREVENSDPDKIQTISCEHIALAELLDEPIEDSALSGVTAAQAGTSFLANTRWSIGTAISTDTDAVSAYYISVWAALLKIRDTWGVKLKPRIVIGTTSITNRYIDIISATPVNRGVRLEISRNLNDIGITYDDRSLYTALIGRGVGQSTLVGDDTNDAKITFEDVVWTTAGGDPANKPEGQKWVEDTAATALYGRGGRKRVGFVEFPEIEDAEELLQATWDYLQTINTPKITIKSTVTDLYAYGYDDELMLLGDEVAVIDDELGVELLATIISMPRNLLEWEKTKPVIGKYRAGLDYLVGETINSSGDVQRMLNSNPDLVNGFATNVNGAEGTFTTLVLKNPTHAWLSMYLGEYTVGGHLESGLFFGTSKAQRISIDQYGNPQLIGDAGITIQATGGAGNIVLIAPGGVYANGNLLG